MSDITIRRAAPDDWRALSELGERTFHETFVEGFKMPYSASDMAEFVPRAYGEAAIKAYLADPAYLNLIAEQDGAAVGYVLAGPNGLPHDEAGEGDLELKRIYVLKSAQGSGLGRRLMDEAMAWLIARPARTIWLGVWSGNAKAQGFYRRYGFEKAGEYRFKVGETLDHEFIFRRHA